MSEGLQRDFGTETGENREPRGAARSAARKLKKTYPRAPQEHYVEEAWVSRALFAARDFGPCIVDPCAGFGTIPTVAMAMGLRAWGCDLVARAPWIAGGRDFLSPRWRAPRELGPFAIVCNPPFGGRAPTIQAFADIALKRAARVALLMPVKRLNAAGAWLQKLPVAEILFVSPRSSLWPGGLHAERLRKGMSLGTGFDDVAWILFDRDGDGAARIGWLRSDG